MGPFSNLKKTESQRENGILLSVFRANEILRIGLSVFMAVFITRLGISNFPRASLERLTAMKNLDAGKPVYISRLSPGVT